VGANLTLTAGVSMRYSDTHWPMARMSESLADRRMTA
jgi:hypothetical protein